MFGLLFRWFARSGWFFFFSSRRRHTRSTRDWSSDVCSSDLGGVPVRTRVGHSFIKAKMAECGAVFGGEHSGHFYFRDFWFADSGMLAALHTLAALGEQPLP